MLTTNLLEVDGTVMLAVPLVGLESLQLQAGSVVSLRIERNRLIIQPDATPHYSLDELLAQCVSCDEGMKADSEWLHGKPVGNELL